MYSYSRRGITRRRGSPAGGGIAASPTPSRQQVRQTLGGIVQGKLKVGAPNDTYEQEADRVADRIVNLSESGMKGQDSGAQMQRKRADREQQAEAVMPIMHRQAGEEGEEETQTKLNSGTLQRQVDDEEEEESVQTKAEIGRGETYVGTATAERINSQRGKGMPIRLRERRFFEPRFGHDFSAVRFHTDSDAVDTAETIHAKAFTLGRDVFFNRGEFRPETDTGRRLIAHELTHVIQQGGADTGARVQRQDVPESPESDSDRYKPLIDNEIESAADRYDQVFESQALELSTLYGQITLKDPPSAWETLLLGAAEGALVAATGGIGGLVSVYASRKVAAVISAGSLQKATQEAVAKICGDVAKDVAKWGVSKLTAGMKSSFDAAVASHPVANDEQQGKVFINSQVQDLINNKTEQGEALRDRKNEFYSQGATGLAAVRAIKEGLNPAFFTEARAKQRNETIQNWAVYLAHSDYGTVGKGTHEKTDMSEDHFWDDLGVLVVEGEWHSGRLPVITSASIDGVNEHLRPEIAKTPIGKLKIPIRCSFDVGYDVSVFESTRTQVKVRLVRDETGGIWGRSTASPGIVTLATLLDRDLVVEHWGNRGYWWTLASNITPYKVAALAFDRMSSMTVPLD